MDVQETQLDHFLQQSRLASQSGLKHYTNHDYGQAIAAFEQAIDYYNRVEMDSLAYHTGRAALYYNLGSAYLAQRINLLSAISWLEESWAIKKNTLKQTDMSLDRVNAKLKQARYLFEEKSKKDEEMPGVLV